MHDSAMKTLRVIASLRLTVPGMLMLATGVLLRYLDAESSVLWIVLPLLLLAVNLLAALWVNPRFRRQPALLMFHICLLLLVVLVAASQLTSLQGRLEIVEGQAYAAAAVEIVRRGPWHPAGRLREVAFTQGTVRVDYRPGLRRVRTESHLGLPADAAAVIGDNTPLEAAGYRFYTTPNKGFAAILTWRDAAGHTTTGAVHFPSYPVNDWRQHNDWTSPDGTAVGLELSFATPPDFGRDWTLTGNRTDAVLQVNVRGATQVLQPGGQLRIGDGILRFETVRLWMGYEIRYEPLLPWLFATAVTGVLALGWHFRRRLAADAIPAAAAARDAGEVSDDAVVRL